MQEQSNSACTAAQAGEPQKCDILGVGVSVTDVTDALGAIERNLGAWRGRYVVACNVHTVVTAQDDAAFRAAENGAVIALADGKPLCLALRKAGYPNAGHVPITTLMEAVFAVSAARGYSHYFYGSTQQTQTLLCQNLKEAYPGIRIAGSEPSLFRPLTSDEDEALLARVAAAKPDFLWVGLGAPRQELFMAAHAERVGALMLGVGGGFDVLAGNVRRAPLWMQRCCLEWLFRLAQEPRRLFSRYLVTNTRFLYLLAARRGK